MKFLITKRSALWEKPCEEAKLFAQYDGCEYKEWTVEINTLEELISLCNKYDGLIIRKPVPDYKECPKYEIEIDYWIG